MANARIKDLTETVNINNDDYLVVDGTTSGTRKILASNIGGGTMYDFTSSYVPTIDPRGVYSLTYTITPSNPEDLTLVNGMQIQGYMESDSWSYPLISTAVMISSTYFVVIWKSIYASVQSTTSTTISGTFHVVAPFEIQSVGSWM